MPAVLPCWDLPAPAVSSADLLVDLADLVALYQRHGVAGGPPLAADLALVDVFEQLLTRTNTLVYRERLLSLTHAGRCWAGGEHRASASAAYLRVQQQLAPVAALRARLQAWVARLPIDWLTARSSVAAAHRRWLRGCHAGRWLPPGEEDLLASVDSTAAWRQLYEDSAARVTASLAGWPDDAAHDQARARRTAAAWAGMAPVAAACLNALLGQEQAVAGRRGWSSTRDLLRHREGLPELALEAAGQATPALLAGLRRFATIRARLLGADSLPYDKVTGPLPGEPRWAWDDARERIVTAFTACEPQLGQMAATAFTRSWIDAAPRPGKRPTALCLPLHDGQARIMVTFDGHAASILHLAHELGHAYHHVRQDGQTEFQRESALMVKELAAMAAEQMIVAAAPAGEQMFLQGAWLTRVLRTCVLGLARSRFEEIVVDQRRSGPLTEVDFDTAAAAANQIVYAAGITAGTAPRHTWISHPHLYTARFHSVPYVLARLAAAALFSAGPTAALAPMLTGSGLTAAVDLFARYGHNLESPAFWIGGAEAITAQVEQFTAAVMPAASPGGLR
ncbi:hypothetical protein [Salinispora arenicola]|uniref:hypothetical protein n=1 Tax=Salinispora arenicola TaxID=168697 RepID=UPI0012FA7372|nr:hypothetical protein [Salinispora arenicola]